jgi:hypothetical protein
VSQWGHGGRTRIMPEMLHIPEIAPTHGLIRVQQDTIDLHVHLIRSCQDMNQITELIRSTHKVLFACSSLVRMLVTSSCKSETACSC